VFIPDSKPRRIPGLSLFSVQAGTDFSEPEIDCSVMAITAAEALPGVHFFTPEMEGSMRGEMINEYEKLNSEDQKTFRRWLWANTVVGAILLSGLIVLASKSPGDKSEATAQNATMHTQAKLKLPPERASVLPSR
jgi:hypothetical protein